MITIYWQDETHVRVESNNMIWTFPIRYPEGRSMFALSDGSLVEATRKNDKPRVTVLEHGSLEFLTLTTQNGLIAPEGSANWIVRAWDFASLLSDAPIN